MIKNNFVTLYTITSILLIAGTNYNIAMDYCNIPNNCTTPQDQFFLQLLAINNLQLLPDEEIINNNDTSNNTLKKRQHTVDTLQGQPNTKKQKIDTQTQYICPQCNKTFSSPGNLKKHFTTIHTNEKPFKCSSCNESFKRKDDLKQHEIREHIKPFICTFCNIGFGSQFRLKKHAETHKNTLHTYKEKQYTENKKYQCNYTNCYKIFKTRSGLSTHIQTKHKNMRYSCSECTKSYTRLENLTIHIQNHHKKN